jgi:hypothetical protein
MAMKELSPSDNRDAYANSSHARKQPNVGLEK